MAPPAQKFGGNARLRAVLCEATPRVIGDYGRRRGRRLRCGKRAGKLPTLDTMDSKLLEETDLEFNWQRNGCKRLLKAVWRGQRAQ